MKKISQTKLSESVQKELIRLYSTTYNGLQSAAEGFLAMRLYTLSELKKYEFTSEELIALIDSLNGVMMDGSMSCSSSALTAQMEDFEDMESGISRHGANAETLLAKIKKLTAAQSFFLQAEISRFWEQNTTKNPISMNEFINTLQKEQTA